MNKAALFANLVKRQPSVLEIAHPQLVPSAEGQRCNQGRLVNSRCLDRAAQHEQDWRIVFDAEATALRDPETRVLLLVGCTIHRTQDLDHDLRRGLQVHIVPPRQNVGVCIDYCSAEPSGLILLHCWRIEEAEGFALFKRYGR